MLNVDMQIDNRSACNNYLTITQWMAIGSIVHLR